MPKFVKREEKKEPEKKRLVVEEQQAAAPAIVEPAAATAAAPVEAEAVAPVVVAPEVTPAVSEPAAESQGTMEGWVKVPEEKLAGETSPPAEEKKSGGGGKVLMFVVGVLVGVAVAAGAILGAEKFGWGKTLPGQGNSQAAAVATPEPTAEAAPTAVPTPDLSALKRSDLKVRVENGSGVAGAAAAAGSYLAGLGYTVVGVGNSTQNVTVTQVSVTADKAVYGQLLVKDLGEKYTAASSTGELAAGGDYDALVTIGQ